MTLSLATPIAVDAAASETGSQSVSIPAGTTSVGVIWHGYSDASNIVSSLTLGGVSMTLRVNQATGAGAQPGFGAASLDSPPTGTQSFAWNWGGGGAVEEGGRFYIFPLSSNTGVARYRASSGAHDTNNPPVASAIASSATDIVIACAQSYTGNSPVIAFGAGSATNIVNDAAYNSEVYEAATADAPGASTTSATMSGHNYSSIVIMSFYEDNSADTTPPNFTVGPGVTPSSSGGTATGTIDETGSIFYVVVADGASAPSSAQVIAGQNASGAAALASGSATATTTISSGFSGLSASTAYDAYFVARDDEGTPNVQASPTLVNFTTSAPAGTKLLLQLMNS